MAISDGEWLPPTPAGTRLTIPERYALKYALMYNKKGVDLGHRPKNWKFDPKSSSVLLDVASLDGLTVGDKVELRPGATGRCLWNLEVHESFIASFIELGKEDRIPKVFTLLAFTEIIGSFKKSPVRMRAHGCILASAEKPTPDDGLIYEPIKDPKTEKLLYFWTRSLQKTTA